MCIFTRLCEGGEKKGDMIITSTTTLEEANFSKYPGAFALRDNAVDKLLYLYADTENDKRAWLKVFEATINEQRKSSVKLNKPPVEASKEPSVAHSSPAPTTATTSTPPKAVSEERVAEAAGAASQVAEDVVNTAVENTAANGPSASPAKPEEPPAAPAALAAAPPTPPPETAAASSTVDDAQQEAAKPEEPPAAPAALAAAPPTPPPETAAASSTVDDAQQEEETKVPAVAVINKQDSQESVGADDEDAVEVEVGVSQAPPEEKNDKTDEELDAALYETIGRGGIV
jgi:hypothetical protein